MRHHQKVYLAAILALGASCSPLALGGAGASGKRAEIHFAALEHSYVVFVFRCYPVVATYLGGSAFDYALRNVDGQLRDYSPAAIVREDATLRQYLRSFAALKRTQLSSARRIDRDVALAQIRFLIHLHQVRRHQEVSLDSYVEEPFRGIEWHLQGMRAGTDAHIGTLDEWRRVILRLVRIPAYLKIAQLQLRLGILRGHSPDWRVLEAYGLEIAAADEGYFRTSFARDAERSMPTDVARALMPALREAASQAADAYADLQVFVRANFFETPLTSRQPTIKPTFSSDTYAVGRFEYDWALKNNLHLAMTAESLMAGALSTVEHTRGEMRDLARTIAARQGWQVPSSIDGTVRAVLDKLAEDGPASDEEARRWYVEETARLIAYARRTGLFSPESDYQLAVTLTPPTLRGAIDDAAYYAAPPFKHSGVGRFYVTGADDDPAKLQEIHNRSAIAVLAAHEGFPGHDWYYKSASRAHISPIRWLTPGAKEDSSSMWEESLPSEGWALYVEALLAEPQPGAPAGIYEPEERLAQLRAKLYRDLRVFIDPALHIGQLSFGDAVDLFSSVVDFLPGTCIPLPSAASPAKRASCAVASRAIFRYSRWPTQAVAYRIGREEIYTLRRQAERRLGPAFSLQAFHMAFIQQGPIPSNYFSSEILNAPQR